jgi:uncharacterized repeat protein (TIGR03806 family)
MRCDFLIPAALAVVLACTSGLTACGGGGPEVRVHASDAPPVRLRDWGVVFADNGVLRVNEAARIYALNTPLFSDYALKLRTIWMPPGTTAIYRDEGPFEFPVGTVISKTFYYPIAASRPADGVPAVRQVAERGLPPRQIDLGRHRLIETRLLVRYRDGWHAFPYVWNAAQTEAELFIAGDFRQLRFEGSAESFTYVVPDQNQCSGCHVSDRSLGTLQPIGPRAWQLNRPLAEQTSTQLDMWVEEGLLSGAPAEYPAGIDWTAPDAALDERATAYLDANCAHCHNADGAADSSALDLRLGVAAGRITGICKPPVAVGRGSGDRPYDIWPGRPADSIMLYRMQHTDPAIAMPELGRSTVHKEAVELLAAWITALPGDC